MLKAATSTLSEASGNFLQTAKDLEAVARHLLALRGASLLRVF